MTPPAGPRQGRGAPAHFAKPGSRAAGPTTAEPARSGRIDASAKLAEMHRASSAHRRVALRRRRAIAGLLGVAVITAAVVGIAALAGSKSPKHDTPPIVTTTTLPAAFSVGMLTENWTNTASGATTENFATGATTAGRHIVTEVFYPSAASPAASAASGGPAAGAPAATKYGPFPVIVFAHGYDLSPSTYQQMLDAWVKAGFVVVAPIFPVDNTANIKALGGSVKASNEQAESDEFNEPNDVAFVVRQLVAAVSDPSSKLHGLIDLHRLALAGQSDGANVIGALVYDGAFRTVYEQLPVHPQAVALLSGAMFDRGPTQSPPDTYSSPASPPAELSSESSGDYCNSQTDAKQLYSHVGGTKWFLVIQGGAHLDPYTGKAPWSAPTSATTTAFFELELGWRSSTAAMKAFHAAGNTTGVTHLQSGGPAPSIPSPPAASAPTSQVACGLPN